MKQPRTKLAHAIATKAVKGSDKSLSRQVAAYLLAERRVSDLDSVLRDIQAEWAEAGHVEVEARSAHPLTPSIRTEIERRVKSLYPQAKKIIITETPDSQIIGGVRLNLPSRQLDLSVEAKLNKFKQLTKGKD